MHGPISDRLRARFAADSAVWNPERRAAAVPDMNPDNYRGIDLDPGKRGEVSE